MLTLSIQVTGAQTNAPASRGGTTDLSSFRVISERNIFDPNRGPRRSNNQSRPKPKTVESVALVGVMSYDKGLVAFFNGSSPQYRKAVKPSESIAGFKLVSINQNSVELASEKKQLELKIGTQLRREDEGEWQLAGKADGPNATAPAAAVSAGNSAASGSSSAASPASSASADEALKRLMQRREQE